MRRCLHRTLKSRRELLDALARRRVLQDPLAPLSIRREQLASIEQRMATAGNNVIERHRSRIQTHAAQLHALSPLKVLGRGYSVTLKDGQELRNWQEISDGDLIETRLAAGYLESKVIRRWMK